MKKGELAKLEGLIRQSPLYDLMERPPRAPGEAVPAPWYSKEILGEFFVTFRKITKEGSTEIITEFTHPKDNTPRQFRTQIELDGDVTNYIPSPKTFKIPEHQQLYHKVWREHQEKIGEYLGRLQRSTNLWVGAIVTSLALLPNAFLIEDLVQMLMRWELTDEVITFGIEIGVLIATIVFRKPLKSLAIKLLMKLAKKFM
jgi:hypothetical protein